MGFAKPEAEVAHRDAAHRQREHAGVQREMRHVGDRALPRGPGHRGRDHARQAQRGNSLQRRHGSIARRYDGRVDGFLFRF